MAKNRPANPAAQISTAAINEQIGIRNDWLNELAYFGIDKKAMKAGKVKEEAVVAVLEKAGFRPELTAEVLRLFFPSPDTTPPDGTGGPGGKSGKACDSATLNPESSLTREGRIEIMRRRVERGMLPYHVDDAPRGATDIPAAPKDKKKPDWFDEEVAAEDEELAAKLALDILDEVPRRRMKEHADKQRKAKESDGPRAQLRAAMQSLAGLAMAN